jgi:hypothetical protein
VVLGLATSSDQLLQVSSIAVLHDYENLSLLFVNNSVVVSDNMVVTELPQNVYLADNLLFFFFTHLAVVELLPNQDPSVRYALDFLDLAKRTLAYVFDDLVEFFCHV